MYLFSGDLSLPASISHAISGHDKICKSVYYANRMLLLLLFRHPQLLKQLFTGLLSVYISTLPPMQPPYFLRRGFPPSRGEGNKAAALEVKIYVVTNC